MKKMIQIILAVLLAMPITAGADNIVRESRSTTSSVNDIGVKIWANNSDGIYYTGENITLYFQTDRDCYVTVYSVDTRGEVSILYPVERWDDGYIRGGETYAIPDDHADYNLTVTGPEGIEHVVAVATTARPDIVSWYDKAPVECGSDDDRDEFIEYVNQQYFGHGGDDFQGQDRALIYVKENHYYYKPVYVPQTWYDYPDYSVVYIDYPFGGEIYIDGIYFGIAPLWIPRVIVGYHWVTIYDRYGYCWEEHMEFNHNHTIYLDRSRIRTSHTLVSRFKDVRSQAKQYTPSSYIKSEQRVRSTAVVSSQSSNQKYYPNSLRNTSGTGLGSTTKGSAVGQTKTQTNSQTKTQTKQSSDRGKYTPSSDVKSRVSSPSVQDNQTKQSQGSQNDRGSSKASQVERDRGSNNSQPSGQKEQKVDSPKKGGGGGKVAAAPSSSSSPSSTSKRQSGETSGKAAVKNMGGAIGNGGKK